MARASKFTEEQRLEIALDMLSGKVSVSQYRVRQRNHKAVIALIQCGEAS